jgi:hypothetical protein
MTFAAINAGRVLFARRHAEGALSLAAAVVGALDAGHDREPSFGPVGPPLPVEDVLCCSSAKKDSTAALSSYAPRAPSIHVIRCATAHERTYLT